MKSGLIRHSPQDNFARLVLEACMVLSPSTHTRRAYLGDANKWIEFCRARQVDPATAPAIVVAAWVEELKGDAIAPKTRNRRLSALSSIYDWLRRHQKVETNPFSALEGPKRETAHTLKPTPIAEAKTVLAALRLCESDASWEGARDAAILRILWVTGVRRSSLIEITHERLVREGEAYTCSVPGKKGKTVRLWFAGKAANALASWLALLAESGVASGPVFRMSTGSAMNERDIWRAVRRRGKQAGGKLMPHSFRVAFLTLNPASLDERQDAAGHSSPDTTRLYQRDWRGKKAFVLMPEVEDVVDGAS